MSAQERIFVQIASYRDVDCQWTVKDLFDQAAQPERVSVGICWQSESGTDQDCFREKPPRPDQVRTVSFDARQSKGQSWARLQAQKLWRGEEYTLQTNSHMRFEKGWDSRLVAMLKKCNGDRPVLSTYPQGFMPPRQILTPGVVSKIVAKEFDSQGQLVLWSSQAPADGAPTGPTASAFLAGSFLFGPASIIADVPSDPHLYFFGEDVTLSVRLWTHGYNIYAPNEAVIHQNWSHKGRPFYSDSPSAWEKITSRALGRVRHLLGAEISRDAETLRELDRYGLGAKRSLGDYEAFTGISFKDRTISARARSFHFPAMVKEEARAVVAEGSGERGNPTAARQSGDAARPAAPAVLPAINHQPTKVLENDQIIVYDDFIAPHLYDSIQKWALHQDYVHINTSGKINKTWRLHDGFPMRGATNGFYIAGSPRSTTEPPYPTNTAFDLLVEQILRIMPDVKHLVGEAVTNWNHFSVSSFAYPRGTGLSMHHDGNNVYSGAYTYFVSPVWNIHWGGLLMVFDKRMEIPPNYIDLYGIGKAWKPVWIDQERELSLPYQPGLALTIVPFANRMVFINPDAYHMITTVTPSAGDNVRIAFSGFFAR